MGSHLGLKGWPAMSGFWFWQKLACLIQAHFLRLAYKSSSCIENSFPVPHSSVPSLQHMWLSSAKRGPDWLSRIVPSVAHEFFYSLIFPKRIVGIFRRTDEVAEYLNHCDFISRNDARLSEYEKNKRRAVTFWILLYLFFWSLKCNGWKPVVLSH